MVRRVIEVKLLDVEKRRLPSKHYVYVIEVFWSDDSTNVVYRRYTNFFDLQSHLLRHFPEEAGAKNPSHRIIPFLPGKKIFVRSHTYDVACSRIDPLRDYCKNLIKLPDKISLYDRVLKFFEPNELDLNPNENSSRSRSKSKMKSSATAESIAANEGESEMAITEVYRVKNNYSKTEDNDIDLVEGTMVDVIEKQDDGWWFVTVDDDQGWAPATHLEKVGSEGESTGITSVAANAGDETYICIKDYNPEKSDEIKLTKGMSVKVEQRLDTGWWLVKNDGKIGWAPKIYLEQSNPDRIVFRREVVDKQVLENIHKDNIPIHEINSGKNANTNSIGDTPSKDDKKEALENESETSYEAVKIRSNNPNNGATVNRFSQRKVQSIYMTSEEFKSEDPDCISFSAGAIAEIVEKCGDWWLVSIDGRKGWAPASHLDKTVRKLSEVGTSADFREIAKPKAAQAQLLQELKTKKQPPPKPPKPSMKPSISMNDVINKRSASTLGKTNNAVEAIKPQLRQENISTSSAVNDNNKSELTSAGGKDNLISQINQMRSSLKSTSSERQVQPVAPPSNKPSSANTTPKIGHKRVLPPRPQLNDGINGKRNEGSTMTASTNQSANSRISQQSINITTNSRPKVTTVSSINAVKNAYHVIYDYVATFEEAIDIKEGEVVDVLEKNDDGWWLIKCRLRQGLVPGSYLNKVEDDQIL